MPYRPKRRHTIRRYTPSEDEISAFYKSKDWAVTRYAVLDQHDGRCVICGRSAAIHGVVMHVDHIKPIRQYWHLRFDTRWLQLTCKCCNRGKSNKTRDWRPVNKPVD